MELKTINEIKALNADDFPAYRAAVIDNNDPEINGHDILYALDLIYREAFIYPTPIFVVKYVLAFLVEHFESIIWRAYSPTDVKIFADDCYLFTWSIEGGRIRCLVLNEVEKTSITDALTALDAGVTLPYLNDITMPSLEADADSMATYASMLSLLNVSNGSSEIIPPISETLSIDEGTARFSSAIWYEEIQKKTIILAGLGGIGSYVAFLLARMHPRALFMYDDDVVETVNMAGQLYGLPDISHFKVDAIASTLRNFASYSSVYAIREKYTEDKEASDIMICGFDNMKARRTFFDNWLKNVNSKGPEERAKCLFIDGRLAAEELQVLCIRGDDSYNIERYNNDFLFSDEEADETLCSYKQTTYMANMIGSIIVNLFTNFVANSIVEHLRDLPFFTSYSADSMVFKTEQ